MSAVTQYGLKQRTDARRGGPWFPPNLFFCDARNGNSGFTGQTDRCAMLSLRYVKGQSAGQSD